MRISRFSFHIIRVPLKRPFRHASASRGESENVVIFCHLEDGTTGYGEGVPRSYVTGETPEGAFDQFQAGNWPTQLASDCLSWPAVIALCQQIQLERHPSDLRNCYGNALRCAIELSILDAFGKAFSEPLCNVARAVPGAASLLRAPQAVRYSTTIDAESADRLWRSALKMRLYGFSDCKVKVGFRDDEQRLEIFRRWLGNRINIRADANEAWSVAELPRKCETLSRFQVSCIEQPLPHSELGALARIKPLLTIPVMLDESLASFGDAERAAQLECCDLFNLRLSKCGGFLACLELAAFARQQGLGYQLGCHPGETGILSAAGRHFASVVNDIQYLEGSYDRHLLKDNVIREEITFGFGGHAPPLNKPGLGVTVIPEQLQRLSSRSAVRPCVS